MNYLEHRRALKLGLKDPTLKPAKEIPDESEKQKDSTKEYLKKRKAYVKKNPYCKAKLNGCTKMTSDIHHKKGRGKNLLVEATWLPVCRNCHDTLEVKPKMAKEKGLSESRLAVVIVHDEVSKSKVTITEKLS